MAYRIIPLFIPHEGCPHACVFCNQKKIAAERSVSPETVRNYLSEALKKPNCTGAELAFYGGSFTAIPVERQKMLLQAAEPFLHDGSISRIRVSTRPDCIDDATIHRLMQFGVKTIELGVQSMCDDVLKLAKRGHTVSDVLKACTCIRKYDIQLGLQVMVGLPGDTREKSKLTAQFIAELQPDFVRIYPVAVIADTQLYTLWKSGEYQALTVEDAVERSADMLEVFIASEIEVIRIGLNPTEELSGGAVVAGGYHPALGEMVRARIYRRRAEALLRGRNFGGRLVFLTVGTGCMSMMAGNKKENINYLTQRYQEQCQFSKLKLRESDRISKYVVTCQSE